MRKVSARNCYLIGQSTVRSLPCKGCLSILHHTAVTMLQLWICPSDGWMWICARRSWRHCVRVVVKYVLIRSAFDVAWGSCITFIIKFSTSARQLTLGVCWLATHSLLLVRDRRDRWEHVFSFILAMRAGINLFIFDRCCYPSGVHSFIEVADK